MDNTILNSSESDNYNVIDFLKETPLDWNNTIPYLPDIKYGKVIKVYDGDTITIATPLFNGDTLPYINTYRFNIRLRGINTPEIKTKDKNEKEIATEAKNFLSFLVMDKIVKLENVSIEKYGRILCDVYVEYTNTHVNLAMLESGFAIPFMI